MRGCKQGLSSVVLAQQTSILKSGFVCVLGGGGGLQTK